MAIPCRLSPILLPARIIRMKTNELKRRSRSRSLQHELLEARRVLNADIRISEFMASNDSTIEDSFGESSDWIEIFNAGQIAANLSGYHLTDDALDLEKWTFPAVNLASGAKLLIFASGRNTVTSSGEIHTSFQLSAGGEYLAVVEPDGGTIVDEFVPGFPPQREDISYGLAMAPDGVNVTRLNASNALKGLVPTDGLLGSSWTARTFNDSAWPISGTASVGYENSPENYAGLFSTALPLGTTTAYLRIPFNVASVGAIDTMTLKMKYDDGFIAYINGVQVAEVNAPDTPAYNSVATAGHADSAAVIFENFDVSSGIRHLVQGTNLLAIHALNLSNSSDMLIIPEIVTQGSQLVVPTQIGYHDTPTPGRGNTGVFSGFVEDVQFSVPRGFYDTQQVVVLSNTTPGSRIVFTRDGSEPAVDSQLNVTNGTLYAGPILIIGTSVIRATAFQVGLRPSRTATTSYLFTQDIINQTAAQAALAGFPATSTVNGQSLDFGMDPDVLALYGSQTIQNSLKSLSTFVINTDVDNLFDPNIGIYVNAANGGRSWERESSVEYILPDGTPGFQVNAGLRIRGGYSRGDFNPKHAFRLYFRGDYGASRLEYPLFGSEGVSSFDVIDLRTDQNYSWASSGDSQNTMVREVFSRDVQRDLQDPYTRSRYHHLYLNGFYWGVFQTQERVQEDYAESYLGGRKDDYDVVKHGLRETGGPTEIPAGNDLAWRSLFTLAQNFANNPTANANNYWTIQGKNPDGTRNPTLNTLVDLDNLIDYMTVIFFTGNLDSGLSNFIGNNIGNNWYGVKNRVDLNTGFQFFQHDAEHSLGVGNTINTDRTGPFNNGNQANFNYFNPQYLHQDLLASAEYRQRFADRVQKHFFNGGVMTSSNNIARYTARMLQVEPAVYAESARWGDAQIDPARNRTDWLNANNWVRNTFFPQRQNVFLNQLRTDNLFSTIAAPSFNQFGGAVASTFDITMSSATGTIYYTLDGSDPRLIGGAISPTALNYSSPGNSPIRLNQDTTILARVWSGSSWSPVVEASFRVLATPANASNLRITEVHYNPTEPTPAELALVPAAVGTDFEFVELLNTGTGPIDLTNVRFTAGITYTLPAITLPFGGRAVIAKSEVAFAARYGVIPGVLVGEYGAASSLSNSGEELVLQDATGVVVQSFTFADNNNWPTFADGRGPSLEVMDLGGNYNDPLNWLPSKFNQGSPGVDGRPQQSPLRLKLTEIHYNPLGDPNSEFVEFQNLSRQPISLTGLRIIEGLEFSFSSGSIPLLPPEQRVVVTANVASFQAVYGSGLPVAGQFLAGVLSNGGERLIVVDASNDILVDLVFDDAAPFPVAADGTGPSLENVHPFLDPGDGSHWRASSILGGTPGTGMRTGDFSGNGTLDCADLAALSNRIVNGPYSAEFDLNQDNQLSSLDVNFWITTIRQTLLGDANLDFVVDGTDFGVWNSNKFTTGGHWCRGDFNSDGSVDGSDFGIWNSNKFTAADASRTMHEIPDVYLPAQKSDVSPVSTVWARRAKTDQTNEAEQVSAVDYIWSSYHQESTRRH